MLVATLLIALGALVRRFRAGRRQSAGEPSGAARGPVIPARWRVAAASMLAGLVSLGVAASAALLVC
ncbi:hypothetical protein [Nocardia sp. NBC_00416]|uniref:hypothetical protein n=1 Tax=Nocardia sp. NBC_00416 TaxID=2975991 RepID=UPI002E2161E8